MPFIRQDDRWVNAALSRVDLVNIRRKRGQSRAQARGASLHETKIAAMWISFWRFQRTSSPAGLGFARTSVRQKDVECNARSLLWSGVPVGKYGAANSDCYSTQPGPVRKVGT